MSYTEALSLCPLEMRPLIRVIRELSRNVWDDVIALFIIVVIRSLTEK